VDDNGSVGEGACHASSLWIKIEAQVTAVDWLGPTWPGLDVAERQACDSLASQLQRATTVIECGRLLQGPQSLKPSARKTAASPCA
jgi:hypothetical protein